jgi:hypothetical protein
MAKKADYASYQEVVVQINRYKEMHKKLDNICQTLERLLVQ